jgi:hypothetical protein
VQSLPTITAKNRDDILEYKMYCLHAENLKQIEQVVKIVRPCTVPRMVLLFDLIVKMFQLEDRVQQIVTRACEASAKRQKSGRRIPTKPQESVNETHSKQLLRKEC